MTEPASQPCAIPAPRSGHAGHQPRPGPSPAGFSAACRETRAHPGPMAPRHRPLGPQVATVLLVEDSRHAAEAVRMLARSLGLRLRRAEDLDTARRHLKVYRPDLALIDLGLPDGSGLELITELASRSAGPCRIVAMSADPAARAEALAAGAQAFVAKPLRLPADMAVLFGKSETDIPLGPGLAGGTAPPEETGRNGGADPLALRDDLQRARRLLVSDDPGNRGYAVSFLKGLGHCSGDVALTDAAAAHGHGAGVARLIAAVDARVTATPL